MIPGKEFLTAIPFFNRLKRQLAAVELTASTLKVVLFKPGSRNEISGLVSRDLRGLTDGEICGALTDAFRELGCRTPSVALIIPTPIVISKNIEVPSTDNRELREIVNLQASRHTPFSREEIIIDYIPTGTYKQNYTKILLLIVTSAAVKKQIALLERAGVRVDKVLLGQEGIGFFAQKAVKTQNSLCGFIHVDDSTTDFSVVMKEKIIFIRSIPIGRQQLSADRGKWAPRFLEEVRRSMDAYHAECIEKELEGFFIAGAIDGLEDIDIALEAQTKLPVRSIQYWNFFLRTAVRPLSEEVSFLDVVASLAAWDECRVNLIPEEVRLKRKLRERGLDLFTTGILLLSLLVILMFIGIGRMYFKSEYLKTLETHYKALSGNARELEKVFQKNSLIRGYLAGRGYSVKVLAELHDLTPVDIGLSDIRFDREGKLTVRGTSDSMSTVFTFVDLLEKSRYFKDVKTKYTTKRQEGKRDVTDFEINALLNKAAE